MKVGFIGLGHMGFGMAENLLRAGHDLTVYNRTPGKDEVLLQKGAHRASQAAEADYEEPGLNETIAVAGCGSRCRRGVHIRYSSLLRGS